MQVAVKVGAEPVVVRERQPDIRFPLRKKRTVPLVSDVTEIVVTEPLKTAPEIVGAAIVGDRFTSAISRSNMKNWLKLK